jgi:hypothetical protein
VLSFAPSMSLVSVRKPFDHSDWIFEPKWDAFRARAYIDGGRCRLVSRRGNVYKSWPPLAVDLSHDVQCDQAVLRASHVFVWACLSATLVRFWSHSSRLGLSMIVRHRLNLACVTVACSSRGSE